MNNFLFLVVIIAIAFVCYLLHRLFDFLSIKVYRNGQAALGTFFTFIAFALFLFFAICLIIAFICALMLTLGSLAGYEIHFM